MINGCGRLARLVGRSTLPLPVEFVFAPGSKVVRYGGNLESQKDVTDKDIAPYLASIVEEGAIRYISVTRDSSRPDAHIRYGRGSDAEFMTTVRIGGRTGEGRP